MNRITRRRLLKWAGQAAIAAAAPLGLENSLTTFNFTQKEKNMPQQAFPDAGDWPMCRGDRRLTGRASLPGEMAEAPAAVWRYKIEAGVALAVIDPDSTKHTAPETLARSRLAPDYLHSPEGSKWGLGPKLVDLYGDGRLVPDPGRAAKLLPDTPGLQTIEFQSPPGSTEYLAMQAVCYAYNGGKKREVWRSQPYDTIQNTNFTIADVDHDDKLEVAFAPHYRVIVYDGQTGRTKHLLKIHSFRNYGFFCCTDLTGDGLLDFVVIADFAMHVDVVKNEGDHLRLLWRRDIEDNIQSKRRIVRPGPNPVLDINGDGRKEILFNLFNETGDGRWHVMAYDALTGATVLDLPESYLNGAADIDGDGMPELFVAHTASLNVPNSAELSLIRIRGHEAAPLWQCPRGQWMTAPTALPLTHTTIVANGTDDIVTARLTDGKRGFFIIQHQADGRERCVACVLGTDGRVAEVWSVTLPARARTQLLACADIDGDGLDETLLSFRQPGCDSARIGPAAGAEARLVALEVATVSHTPYLSLTGRPQTSDATRTAVVADARRRRSPLILFEGADNDIVALSPPAKAGGEPSVRWRVSGAGPPVLADVNGDGLLEAVFAGWADNGEGLIVAAEVRRGRPLWRHRVDGFPGPHPPWNFGGITTWWVGRYTARSHDDVWVSARRSTMHSDEAWVLRGTDGNPVWHLREVRTDRTPKDARGWGAGGGFVCSADVDGDGLEDVISLYPVNYMAAKGTTGTLIRSIEAASGLFEGVWGAYCQPMVADFNGDGRPELLWCGDYHHGLTTLEGRVLWYHKGGASMAGVGDVDGDRKLELGLTGWEQGKGLRCLDAATGALKWEWPLEGNPRSPVYTADIDGDGRDEFLFAHNATLYALNGKGGAPGLVWQVELPSRPGSLALSDVDCDGKIEILFIGDDSTLYCLDRSS